MEQLKAKRIPLRSAFTRTFNSLEEILESPQPNSNVLEPLLDQLEDKADRLQQADDKILDLMLQAEVSQEDYNKEFDSCEAYVDKLISCKTKVKKFLSKPLLESTSSVSVPNLETDITTTGIIRPSLRLPEISLKQFDGDPRSWLNFWNTFKKIHEDPLLDDHSKFVYLIQATTPKSKARDIVDSFPTSTENYPKVIQHLKQRFGRNDTLIQVYVRDILQLVLCNNSGSKKDFNLSSLYDNLETRLRSLESLGVTEDKYASILFPLVESCLPYDILRIWERERNKTTEGKSELNSILEFLRNEVMTEERVLLARASLGFDKAKKQSKVNTVSEEYDVATANDLIVGEKFKDKHATKKFKEMCIFCDGFHLSEKCFKVRSLSYDSKKSLILKKGACFICLRRNHISCNCRAKVKCILCGKRHLTIMCQNILTEGINAGSEMTKSEVGSADTVLASQATNSDVLLQTLIVRVQHRNRVKIVRAIIDTGSERTYLTKDVIKYLNYESCGEIKLIHKLFGGVEITERLHRGYKIHLSSMDNHYNCDMYCLDQSVICSDIKKVPDGPWIHELNKWGIQVTDIETNILGIEKEIKLLIGSDVAGSLLIGNVKFLKSGPVAVQTRLGWTVMGKIPGNKTVETNNTLMVNSLFLNESSAANLWKLEIIGINDPVESKTKSEIHEETMAYFKNTLKVDSDGRYEIALPWALDNSRLPSNKELAEKRLATMRRKLLDLDKIEIYQEVFDTWLKEQIIEEVAEGKASQVHYLPHRPVFKESSETTKVRPVFDAAAHVKGSPSLNDCLDKGPNLIEIIPTLLTRFRKYSIGVVSDIEKAFLQIGVREKDRDYLRFLWKDDEEKKTKIYRQKRVVFGVNCSPFLLVATLNHHLENAPDNLSSTAKVLKEYFYVDNCVNSFNTIEEVNEFIMESRELLSSAKFNLRGWQSNFPISITTISQAGDCVPVLGLNWDLKDDTLSCKIDFQKEEQIVATKRALLSAAHKVFDPIGFTSPVTLLPKLILQECWKLQLKWDEILPEHLKNQFLNWVKGIGLISNVKIQRWIGLGRLDEEEISLHIFCDASKYAYATCIFLRVKTNNHVSVRFIQSRTRVAPLKNITIPRLELLSCCIGARLGSRVIADMEMSNLRIFYWSDSTTALSWIQRDARWGTFVWNRVQEIRTLTQVDEWRHIAGKMNPADLPSRGCSAEQFSKMKWWEGPSWLSESECSWPKSDELPDEDTVNSEKCKSVLTAHNENPKLDNWYYSYFSSYRKIVRLIAWISRFINKLRKIDKIQASDLTYCEIERAERTLIILIQKEAFNKHNQEKIRGLRPVIDDYGIIRVKTQVIYRQDTTDFKYPVLLPSDHPVVHLLISWKHHELLHAGVSLLMTNLRENYWILKARKTIRGVVQRCVRCKRFSAQKVESIPVALPAERVQDAAVFQIIGIDLAGPLYLKEGQKSWIVLYTCAVYRAVHLELVTSLSTEAFLQSLRRFIARRGRPTTIYSDNGKNFVGAEKAFANVDWEQISAAATIQRIRWKFNPPTAAWWGGWWERLIQMVKRILRKVLGKASLSYEELITMLCDCEQVVNSRPLTYVTEDLDDLAPLTPSMFLQETKSSDVLDIDVIDTQELNKRIKYRKRVRDHLRRRFRIEYLGQLRQQTLHQKKMKSLSVDDVVLVESDKKRAYWSLARIIELIPGKDGQHRVARIKTECGELVRPIQKLYHLEIQRELPSVPALRTRNGRKVTIPERLVYN